MKTRMKPEQLIDKRFGSDEETKEVHPAYGVVKLTKAHSSEDIVMFGSDVTHRTTINLSVHTAYKRRSLHNDNDWVSDDEMIVDLSFSPAQWGQFVSSIGDGSGTPCTINYRQCGKIIAAPYIERMESITQTFSREAFERNKKVLTDLQTMVEQLAELGNGKSAIPKGEFKKLVRAIANRVENMPSNAAFSIDQFSEAMDKIKNEVKSEVDAFLGLKLMQTGISALKEEFLLVEVKDGIDRQQEQD